MSEERSVVDMTPEELEEWMDTLESSPEEIPCYYFFNPDPYAKCELSHRELPEECYFDEEGNIHVKNISAYWIPEFTMTQEISGTVYKVSGSYEGTEFFTKKIERIRKVHKYEDLTGLTPRFLRDLVSGIYVSAPDKSTGKRRQSIHIKYDGIGFIPLEELTERETA